MNSQWNSCSPFQEKIVENGTRLINQGDDGESWNYELNFQFELKGWTTLGHLSFLMLTDNCFLC